MPQLKKGISLFVWIRSQWEKKESLLENILLYIMSISPLCGRYIFASSLFQQLLKWMKTTGNNVDVLEKHFQSAFLQSLIVAVMKYALMCKWGWRKASGFGEGSSITVVMDDKLIDLLHCYWVTFAVKSFNILHVVKIWKGVYKL